jgi:hypothetical protein
MERDEKVMDDPAAQGPADAVQAAQAQTPPDEAGEAGAGAERQAAEAEAQRLLDAIPADELEAMKVPQLRALATADGLSGGGKREELIRRLIDRQIALRMNAGGRYVAGKTLCPVCRSPMYVRGTVTEPMADGRVMITRKLRCQKRGHTTSLKEIVGQAHAAGSGQVSR